MEEEEDFDETNHLLTNLIINICFKSILQARVEQSSNVKSTQKQPSPHQFNRSSIEEEKSDLKKSSHSSQTPNKQSVTSFPQNTLMETSGTNKTNGHNKKAGVSIGLIL